MVEWYPHVLTVSTLHPVSPTETLNMVEFYYPEEIAAFEREFVEAQREAYMETCIEDDEIAERMDAGRKALLARGDNEVGPYQSPMEDGMQHFHEWYCEKLSSPLRRLRRHPPRGASPAARRSRFRGDTGGRHHARSDLLFGLSLGPGGIPPGPPRNGLRPAASGAPCGVTPQAARG